jgi:outer membrane protein OmpA-like peptidoglycan-associated protein
MKRLLLPVAALLITSCVTSSKIRASAQVIRTDIERARQIGAYTCAPRELATAEANLDFAEGELSSGSSSQAEDHLRQAEASIKKALELSQECMAKAGPKEPKLLVKIEEVDTDKDGIPDKDDKCPTEPGPAKNFGCPIGDRDGDGIPDDVDRCPDQPEDFDGFQDEDGCPDLDNDNDGVPDALDRCPNMPGPADNQGCPKDYKMVIVQKDRIQIKQQLKFASGSAKIIGRMSNEVLRDVAQALKDNQQIQKVRIEGHTDSVGRALANT